MDFAPMDIIGIVIFILGMYFILFDKEKDND